MRFCGLLTAVAQKTPLDTAHCHRPHLLCSRLGTQLAWAKKRRLTWHKRMIRQSGLGFRKKVAPQEPWCLIFLDFATPHSMGRAVVGRSKGARWWRARGGTGPGEANIALESMKGDVLIVATGVPRERGLPRDVESLHPRACMSVPQGSLLCSTRGGVT